MVLDCRPVSACHKSSPFSALSTPASLANLNLAPSWAGPLMDGGPHAGAVDLTEGYYQFLVPEVSYWFGSGVESTAGAEGLSSTAMWRAAR